MSFFFFWLEIRKGRGARGLWEEKGGKRGGREREREREKFFLLGSWEVSLSLDSLGLLSLSGGCLVSEGSGWDCDCA